MNQAKQPKYTQMYQAQSPMKLIILSMIWIFKTKNSNKEINGIFCLY
jgi:hypothetical protein